MAFSVDGDQIVAASGPKVMQLWDVATGRLLQSFERLDTRDPVKAFNGGISSLDISPDCKWVVSGSMYGEILLWVVDSGALLHTLKSIHFREGRIDSVAFSPDGMQVVSGSIYKEILLWDVASGALLHTLKGNIPFDRIISVAFLPDGEQVVSRSRYGKVLLWDVASGAPLHPPESDTGSVDPLAFPPSPADKMPILSISNNWVVKGDTGILWLPPECRATCSATSNGILVIGHSSGKTSFFSFGDEVDFHI